MRPLCKQGTFNKLRSYTKSRKEEIKIKKISVLIILFLLVLAEIIYSVFLEETDTNLQKVTVAEVTHSIFYTPWYVAIENGYFEEEGIEIDLVLTSGADKVSAALLSNDAQIGLAGPESSIYVYNGGEENHIVSFAGLTKRDGQFIVSKTKIEDFTLEDLQGSVVLAGRIGGMPVLNFQTALNNSNVDLSTVEVNTSVDFANLSSTFISTDAEFVNLFEPTATKLEALGAGFVVASVGELSGEVPYTTFLTREEFFTNNQELLQGFTRALQKGIDFTFNNSPEDIAEVIAPQFPSSSLTELTTIIDRYRSSDSWYQNTTVKEEAFNNLQEMMLSAEMLETKVPFNDLVKNLND